MKCYTGKEPDSPANRLVYLTASLRVLGRRKRSRTMILDQPPLGGALPATSPTSPGRGRWNWQRAARGIWMAFAVVLLVIFVVNIPAFFQYAGSICTLP